jgi:AP-1 complex subunit beta-1
LSEKPHISDDSYNTYDENLIDTLLTQISTLSSVYHKTPEEMAQLYKKPTVPTPVPKKEDEKKEDEEDAKKETRKSPTTKIDDSKKKK